MVFKVQAELAVVDVVKMSVTYESTLLRRAKLAAPVGVLLTPKSKLVKLSE